MALSRHRNAAAAFARAHLLGNNSMDLRKLKTLIELVESSGIAELEIQEGEERVRITRSVAAGQQARNVRGQRRRDVRGRAGSRTRGAAAGRRGPRREKPDGRHVLSFGNAGLQAIRRGWRQRGGGGATLCIVEAMKLMNEIEAGQDRRGEGDPHRERAAGRIRPTALRHRLTRPLALSKAAAAKAARQAVRQDPDRQPRRDRAAHPARMPRDGHQDGCCPL